MTWKNICTSNLAGYYIGKKFGGEFYVVIDDRKWLRQDGAKTRDQIVFFAKEAIGTILWGYNVKDQAIKIRSKNVLKLFLGANPNNGGTGIRLEKSDYENLHLFLELID